MDMNSVNLTGRLTDAPTLRYTNDNKPVAALRIAVNGRNDRVDFEHPPPWRTRVMPRAVASGGSARTRVVIASAVRCAVVRGCTS